MSLVDVWCASIHIPLLYRTDVSCSGREIEHFIAFNLIVFFGFKALGFFAKDFKEFRATLFDDRFFCDVKTTSQRQGIFTTRLLHFFFSTIIFTFCSDYTILNHHEKNREKNSLIVFRGFCSTINMFIIMYFNTKNS